MVDSQHAIMYVAPEAESNTISSSEMNRSGGYVPEFLCDLSRSQFNSQLVMLAADGFEIAYIVVDNDVGTDEFILIFPYENDVTVSYETIDNVGLISCELCLLRYIIVILRRMTINYCH